MRKGFDRLLRDKTRPSRIKPLSAVYFLPCLSFLVGPTPTHAGRCSIASGLWWRPCQLLSRVRR
jgi:hypothetical protein